MVIQLNNIGRRFRFDWIFRGLDYTFEQGQQYAILGPNGSGKSTLLKIIAAHLSPTKGTIAFKHTQQQLIDRDEVYRYVSYAAPYIELIEELTLLEMLRFHQKFKPYRNNLEPNDLIALLQFSKSKHKPIQFFSSGMKQRLKLILALCSDTPIVLLDEPTTNLDEQGIAWYRNLIQQYSHNRLLIIASNVEHDYDFCDKQIDILRYKKKQSKIA